MKRQIQTNFWFLLPLLWVAFSGCESSLEFPQEIQPRLTIVSHLAPQSWEGQKVHVFVSQAPSDSNSFYTPSDLLVQVVELETDVLIGLDSAREDGELFFVFPQGFLKSGNTYRITASAPGFDPVHATTKIPFPSTIANLEIKDIKIEPSQKHDFKSIVRYTLQFDINHADENRYYHVLFYNQYQGINELLIIDPELSDDQPFLLHYNYGILIDREDMVPGQPLVFQFVDWVVENGGIERVYVELRSITEEYYRYHSTLARQLLVRQDPFAEPVTIYNNIQGGYGNFSGFTPDVSSSDLPR